MSLHPFAEKLYKTLKQYEFSDPEFFKIIQELKTPKANDYIYDFLYVLIKLDVPTNTVNDIFHYHHKHKYEFIVILNNYQIAGEHIQRLSQAIYGSKNDYVHIANHLFFETLNKSSFAEWISFFPYITSVKIDETNYSKTSDHRFVYHCIRTHMVDIDYVETILKSAPTVFGKKSNITALMTDVYQSSFYTDDEKERVGDAIQRAYNKHVLLNKHS